MDKTLTLLFGDMVGSTVMSATLKRGADLEIKQAARQVVEAAARRHQGRLVKTMGDGFLMTFESPTNAVLAGILMQAEFKARAGPDHAPIQYRIGIHTGEVSVDEHGDVYGAGANLAARIESVAEPGRVFLSSSTYHSMNKAEVNADYAATKTLKGFATPISVYRALIAGETPARAGVTARRRRRALLVAILAVAVVGLGYLWHSRTASPDRRLRSTRRVSVPVASLWTATGIRVARGDRIEISATGDITAAPRGSPQYRSLGPDGTGRSYRSTPVPGLPGWSLIGRVEDGVPFAVGAHGSAVADRSGELYLGINDFKVDDNEGEWDAEVTVWAE